ncbi:rod shape-determining protein MreD [Zhongshania sp.]|uniref:Rod shape-determining protein MreD n=1 Tax=Zhongshania aquimaris TaxID=2857107 RepID=A0ABS6VRC4_9GAMM|nr:rod shape-determining protein MreD [Zhongshania sp.]MBQ0795733.1 rod shape-determining protein MreD [Zhongshania sp.]MBW2940256.1 rod shape-determining protein MreD [Zhongshania aquimaris]|tara:strand:+ start:1196 stop:1681 length:486 start_codon:yes stop_codon:yes gene_type:complete
MESHAHGLWFVVVTIFIALLLSITPLSPDLSWARPDWLLLILVYWLLALPERVGVIVCWLCGILLDVLQGGVLGQNAFAFAVVAYIIQVSYQRLRMFSLRKQAAFVLLLELFHILVDQWAQNINGVAHTHWLVFLPALTTGLLWLFVRPIVAWWQRLFVVF